MQKTRITNVLLQALKPRRFPVMFTKLLRRLADEKGLLSRAENLDWVQAHSCDYEELANKLSPALWEEAREFGEGLRSRANEVLGKIEYDLGGPGIFPFLYFLARYMKPDCIVETGVAAGYSSSAFLAAIQANRRGRLYSSDFPYFRLPDPERYIGILVDEPLRKNWELYIDGDEANLPKIIGKVGQIDIFHYDSDKSYCGRRYAMAMIEKRMTRNGIIIMDDVQETSFFHDYVTGNSVPAWSTFGFAGKYIGLVGKLADRCSAPRSSD